MTTTQTGPPVIQIVKNGYVRLFSEDGDPIDIPADYALAVAVAVEDRRDELEAALATDRWFSLASQALSIVRTVPLIGLPKLTVDRYRYADDMCVLDVWDEDDLHAIAGAYDAPISAEPRYRSSTEYAAEIALVAYVGEVRVACNVTDAYLGAVLADVESVSA